MTDLLRLIQITDLHCAPRTPGFDVAARSLVWRAIVRFSLATPIPVLRKIAQGTAGQSPAAWRDLRASIVAHVKNNAPWPETRLVVTGDLSTWGDDLSIEQAIQLADSIAQDAGLPKPLLIHGNHDVWAGRPGALGGLPVFSLGVNLGARRTALRQRFFPRTQWPRHPLAVVPMPTGRNLVVFALDTIEHHHWRNFLAAGYVRADRFWEQPPGANQLASLAGACGPQDVGVALTHHPVHDEGHPPAAGPQLLTAAHVLNNAGMVATALGGPPQRAHAVLSGHTHDTFPRVGASTGGPPAPVHGPLGANQLQLVAGTASQNQLGPIVKPHVWQALHFSCDPGGTRLKIERIVFARRNDLPGFAPVSSDPNDPQAVADVWELNIP